MRSAVGLTSNLCCSKVLLGSLSCRWSHGAAIARVHGALRRSALSHSPLLIIATRASSSPASSPTSSDFLVLSDKDLLTQCKMDTFRASGPGGQHRNKTESAVRLKHIPTGLVSQASEDRSQHINRSYALSRLRQQIALKVRRPVELLGYKPPPEFLRILPTGKGQRSSGQQIGPNHADFPQGMQALLDLISATDGSVSVAANLLGISTSALSKIITSEKNLQLAANEIRASKGLKPLH